MQLKAGAAGNTFYMWANDINDVECSSMQIEVTWLMSIMMEIAPQVLLGKLANMFYYFCFKEAFLL